MTKNDLLQQIKQLKSEKAVLETRLKDLAKLSELLVDDNLERESFGYAIAKYHLQREINKILSK